MQSVYMTHSVRLGLGLKEYMCYILLSENLPEGLENLYLPAS